MGVGQVISDTFGMVKVRFGPLLGLWATYFAITIGIFIVMGIGIGMTGMVGLAALRDGNALAAGGAMLLLMIVFYVGYLLVAVAQYASLISMASPTGRPTYGEALGAGWRAAPALLLLMVVLAIGYIATALVFSLISAAAAALGDAASAVLALVFIPVLVWAGCRLSLLFAVVTVDRIRNPFTAIGRSWQLTRGHALTIFLASLVFTVLLVIACGVVLLPSIGALRSMADPTSFAEGGVAGAAFGGLVLFGVGMLVVSVLFNLLYCSFMAVVHGTLTTAAGEGTAETFA